jgi:hypothetical protein
LTLVSTNFSRAVRIWPTSGSPPPSDGCYHHDPAAFYSLIKLAEPFADLEWHLFVPVTATDIRIIPYTGDAALYGRGWFFAKSDTDLSVSEMVIPIFGTVFRIPIITPWVVVYGNSDERTPSCFIFDRSEADGSMLDQESLRKQIASDFPGINVVNRLYEDEVDLPPADATSPAVQHITGDRVHDALDLGPHFLSLSGHGSQGGCCEVGATLAQNANNGFLQPVVYAMSCLTSDFGAEDAASEKLLQNPHGGAVGYVGYTRFGWIGVGDDFERAFFSRIKATRHLALLNDSRLGLANNWTRFVQVLLGDPEMPVWVGKPTAIAVAHPAAIVWGTPRHVTVTVKTSTNEPVKDAVVSFAKDQMVVSATTDASGTASLHVGRLMMGSMEVVVTAIGCVPYFGTIAVKPYFGPIAVKELAPGLPQRTAVAPKIDAVPFKDFVDIAKVCGVKDIKELAQKRNTPKIQKTLAKLNPANRKSLVSMLKKIGNA